MKALVVYDSEFGNTEQVAKAIARALEARVSVSIARAGQYGEASWQGVDLLVVGCPTQAWRATKDLQSFLGRVPKGALAHTAVAAFDTRDDKPAWLTGSAAKQISTTLGKAGARDRPAGELLRERKRGAAGRGRIGARGGLVVRFAGRIGLISNFHTDPHPASPRGRGARPPVPSPRGRGNQAAPPNSHFWNLPYGRLLDSMILFSCRMIRYGSK